MIDTAESAHHQAAKWAGWAFLLTVPLVVYTNFAIHERLFVSKDAVATARNILANEGLYRIGIACDLIYVAGLLTLVVALYQALKPVQRNLALLAAAWRFIYALMWLRMTLNLFDALRALKVDYLHAFGTEQLQDLAKFALTSGFDQYYVGLLFWGIASTLCSWLWLKSNYVPKPLALFGVASSVWAAFCTFAFILDPDFSKQVNLWWFDTPIGLFELSLSLWLLFKGMKLPAIVSPAASAA